MGLVDRKREVEAMMKQTAQEDGPLKLETLELPQGNSLAFHQNKSILVYEVDRFRATPIHLDNVINSVSTTQDASELREAFKKWFMSADELDWDASTRTEQIVEKLFSINQQDALFMLLCNRYGNRLIPTVSHLDRLLLHYSAKHIESKSIDDLDAMYKTYTLYLYYDFLPNSFVYNALISAGLYGKTSEGIERSIVTMNEQRALGIPLLLESEILLAWHNLQNKKLEEALVILKGIENPNLKSTALEISAYVDTSDLKSAVTALERFVSLEKNTKQEKYTKLDISIQGILLELAEKVEATSDPTLILRVQSALKISNNNGGIGSTDSFKSSLLG